MTLETSVIEAKPLEDAKKQYFHDFESARFWLYQINIERSMTPKLKVFGFPEARFKSFVLKLFNACKVKFRYYPTNESVKLLIPLVGRVDYRITLRDAETLFELLTEFLEVNGVTRYEDDKLTSG